MQRRPEEGRARAYQGLSLQSSVLCHQREAEASTYTTSDVYEPGQGTSATPLVPFMARIDGSLSPRFEATELLVEPPAGRAVAELSCRQPLGDDRDEGGIQPDAHAWSRNQEEMHQCPGSLDTT